MAAYPEGSDTSPKGGDIVAILVAAGRGTRAGAGGPKQYRELAGEPILARTALVFLGHPKISRVRIIIHRDDEAAYSKAMDRLQNDPKLMAPVVGGAERQDSVRLGLESLEATSPAYVLIHDAARPFVDVATIDRVIAAVGPGHGAIAALPVFDTIKLARTAFNNAPPQIDKTVPRDALWRAQTPQGFSYADILRAHRSHAGQTLTDDASVAEAANIPVALVAGSPDNMKITQAEDFGMAEVLLRRHEKDN
ncbi:MAG: 2-C-methyl-D-erythritol 4-phosphate cytidylyltransferase [Pseudomonadota bacterium]